VRHGHPEVAYRAMLRLAGALSTFAIEGSAADLPDYDHDDLGTCFTVLDARIRDLMETVIPDKYFPIPLLSGDRFTWSGIVPDDNLFHNTQFYLAVSAPMGIDEIIRNVPKHLKLSGPDDIERLIRNSLPGIGLRHVEHPPKQIPMKLGNQYFALNQSGDIWKNIMLSRRLAVFAPAEVKEPKMEIVVVME
jgi:type VI secretion system protein ImpJ